MGAGGILLCSHRAVRGRPVGSGPRESGHQLPLSVPQHLALPHLLTGGRGGMHFLVPFPGLNGKVKLNTTRVYNCARPDGSPAHQRISAAPSSRRDGNVGAVGVLC